MNLYFQTKLFNSFFNLFCKILNDNHMKRITFDRYRAYCIACYIATTLSSFKPIVVADGNNQAMKLGTAIECP